jgi:hypothetical protein
VAPAPMRLSPPTATSSSGAPLPRRVTSSRCGVRNDADLSFPPALRRGPSSLYRRDRRSFSQSRRPSWAFPGPSRVPSPSRPSPPARARPPRRSWPSTTRRPRARRAARRAELRCPPTRHHHAVASRRRIGAGGVVAAAFALDDDRHRRTPDHAGTAHPRRQGRCGRTSHPRTRTLAVRRVRLQAQGGQVALPHQRAQARVPVDQSKPPPHPHPATATAGASSTEDVPPLNVGRLKHEWSLLPIRVRGIEPVRLHADLTILAKLACALARARPRTARGVAVRSRTHAWSAVLHPALHSPLQGSASARPVDQPVSKECSGTNAELPMSTPSFANPS